MAVSVNKVILIGNLGRDPELRTNQDGGRFLVLSVATSEQWKDRVTEEKKERTEWHRVVIFNPYLVDRYEKILRKGHKIFVEGALQTRKWTDQNNVEQRTHEVCLRYKGDIILLDSKDGGGGGPAHHHIYAEEGAPPSTEGMDSLLDDEIPF